MIVPLPIPYKILPITITTNDLKLVDNATNIFPIAIREVANMEPIEVPNISMNTPPRIGRIVLTNDTDD
jgi:hypothetical protein